MLYKGHILIGLRWRVDFELIKLVTSMQTEKIEKRTIKKQITKQHIRNKK